jgi:putative transposase
LGAQKYRTYPDSVKLEIARCSNPHMFPELKIPRTTALYWIEKSARVEKNAPGLLESERIQKLQDEIDRQSTLLKLVVRVRMIYPHGFSSRKTVSRIKRRLIIEAIQEASQISLIDDCLTYIRLPKSRYAQWLSEFFLCQNDLGSCDQRLPHQLTAVEIQTMRRLVMSTKYSHIPLHSLCLFAQRSSLLFCSVDSWYKYKTIFGWTRAREITKTRIVRAGIRASRPNEIWHIDVTEVKTTSNQKFYVQVVYDNFSRFVVAWQVTTAISAASTVDLLDVARAKVFDQGSREKTNIMMDGGPENDNRAVLKFITSKNLKRLIARVDVRFSNSMVESLFRGLKSNFLRTEVLSSKKDVLEKVSFYFNEHNDVIPRSQFRGATPKEMFFALWTDQKIEELNVGYTTARENRILTYRKQSCVACSVTAASTARLEARGRARVAEAFLAHAIVTSPRPVRAAKSAD